MTANKKTIGQLSYETGQDATMRMMGARSVIFEPQPWEVIAPELQGVHEQSAGAVVDRCIELIKYEASFMDLNGKEAARRFVFVLEALKQDGGK